MYDHSYMRRWLVYADDAFHTSPSTERLSLFCPYIASRVVSEKRRKPSPNAGGDIKAKSPQGFKDQSGVD